MKVEHMLNKYYRSLYILNNVSSVVDKKTKYLSSLQNTKRAIKSAYIFRANLMVIPSDRTYLLGNLCSPNYSVFFKGK